MTFDELISRADDETLQNLVGGPVVRLLRLLDPTLASPSRLRRLLLELRSPVEILRDQTARSEILALLPLSEAKELANTIAATSDADPYPVLCGTPVRKNSPTEKALFGVLDVVPEPDPEVSQSPSTCSAECAYPLFPHQRTAARQTAKLLGSGPRRVLLHMPTGAGKTRTAMNIVCDFLRSQEPALVVWLAYSEELCEQAASEFESAWNFLGNRSLNVHRYWGNHGLNMDQLADGLLVAGLSKAYSAARDSIQWLATLADKTSLVIIDEAHQAIAETYSLILNGIESKQERTSLLGLTATPGRTWNDIDADEKLANFFGRRKVTLHGPSGGSAVEYLIAEGYLARPRFLSLHHSGSISLTDRDRRELAEQLDIPARILRRFAEDEQRNLAIVTRVEQMAREHCRILVFAATVEHAKLLAVVLRARGLDAGSVTGATPSFERQRLIQHYRSGKEAAIILCNYGVLTTGFDAPKTSAALIARPTKSLVLYSQMLGRAIRGPRAGGNEEAEVVTVVDTSLPGFSDLGEAFLNWEDVWA